MFSGSIPLCLIVGGRGWSNKMHQLENYQDYLKSGGRKGGGGFTGHSFLMIKLTWGFFFSKICSLTSPLQLGKKVQKRTMGINGLKFKICMIFSTNHIINFYFGTFMLFLTHFRLKFELKLTFYVSWKP